MENRRQIRSRIRKTRRNLTALQQHNAAHSLCEQALQFIRKRGAQHIALYLPVDGEISTLPLIHALWQQGKSVYLPVLHPFSPGHLLFLAYGAQTPMTENGFGIAEPKLDCRAVQPTDELDLIFTPLVAFDRQKNRLGMGGGFYDRTLENWQQKHFVPVGLAHACQQVESLPTESWDIPLFDILSA